METVMYNGKTYNAIRVPESPKVKLYSTEKRYKGRYIATVNESELQYEPTVQENISSEPKMNEG